MSMALKNKTKLRDIVDVVADYGADPTGVADSTTAIQNAINATGYGKALYFPSGDYKVTDTLLFVDKRGARFFGAARGEFGASGARIVWSGGNTKPMARLDFFKGSSIENMTWVGADTTTNLATSCLTFNNVSISGSSGPAFIRNCYFDNATYGVQLGDTAYADTYNVSEITFEHCRFNCVYGLYVAGVATGGQQVNQRLLFCDFGGALSQRGIWIAGGNVFAHGCSWNGSSSASPFTAVYVTGNVSLSIPITFRDCYAEQIAKFLETEFTATTTEFFRTGLVRVSDSFLRCNRPLTATAYLVECYKDLEIDLSNVVCTDGAILFSPPADPSFSGYSTTSPLTNPSANILRLSGQNTIAGGITTSRGGYYSSTDRGFRGTVPFGYMFPATPTLTITGAIKSLPEYGIYASYGTNATFDVATLSGGKTGDVVHLMGHPSQATFRINNIKHGTGNIFLATGADFLINTATKKVVLKKDVSGNWLEIGRVTV